MEERLAVVRIIRLAEFRNGRWAGIDSSPIVKYGYNGSGG